MFTITKVVKFKISKNYSIPARPITKAHWHGLPAYNNNDTLPWSSRYAFPSLLVKQAYQ